MLDRFPRALIGGLVALALASSMACADVPAPPDPTETAKEDSNLTVAVAKPNPGAEIRIAPPRIPPIPPLSPGRIAGELGLGSLLGLVGLAVALAPNLVWAETPDSNPKKQATQVVTAVGALGLISLGITVGVTAVGDAGDETGSFRTTFLVTLGSVGIGALAGALRSATDKDESGTVDKSSGSYSVLTGIVAVVAVATPIVAVIAFNRTRHYDRGSAQVGSLVNVSGDHVAIGFPIPIRTEGTTGISLASGSF